MKRALIGLALAIAVASPALSRQISGPAGLFIRHGDSIDVFGDVDTTGKTGGHCFVYNGGTSKWESAPCPGGGGAGESTLEVAIGGAQVSSPTATINLSSHVFTATQSPVGTANIGVNVSSVTLMGNTFNAASLLLQLNSSGFVPSASLDDAYVTKLGQTIALGTETSGDYVESLVAGMGIDVSASGPGADITVTFNPAKVTGSRTFGAGNTANITWCWDIIGTDPCFTFTHNAIQANNLGITGTLTANALTASTLVAAGLAYPTADGLSGQSLVTDGAGNLSFSTVGGVEGGVLVVSTNGVTVSSPTTNINFLYPISATLEGITTAQVFLDPSSVTMLGPRIDLGVDTDGAYVSSAVVMAPILATATSGYIVFSLDTSSVTMLGPTLAVDQIPLHAHAHAVGEIDEIDMDGFSVSSGTISELYTSTITFSDSTVMISTAGILSDTEAASTYLTQSSATATYFQIASTMTLSDTYLTNSSATATYFQIASTMSLADTYLTNSSATVTYLSTITAASTYLTQSSATATYLQEVPDISADYLTTSSATATYFQIASTMTLADTYLTKSSATATYLQAETDPHAILNQDTLQAGATFYVSSGTVAGELSVDEVAIIGTDFKVDEVSPGDLTYKRLSLTPNELITTRLLLKESWSDYAQWDVYGSGKITHPTFPGLADIEGGFLTYLTTSGVLGLNDGLGDDGDGSVLRVGGTGMVARFGYVSTSPLDPVRLGFLHGSAVGSYIQSVGFGVHQKWGPGIGFGGPLVGEVMRFESSARLVHLFNGSELRFWDVGGDRPVGIRAPNVVTSSYTIVLPAAIGTAEQAFVIDSVSGSTVTMKFATPSGAGDAVLASTQTWAGSNVYTSTAGIQLSYLTSKDCVGTDADGNLIEGTCTGGGGGSGGYAVEPATVTFQLDHGFTASTGTLTGLLSGQKGVFTYTPTATADHILVSAGNVASAPHNRPHLSLVNTNASATAPSAISAYYDTTTRRGSVVFEGNVTNGADAVTFLGGDSTGELGKFVRRDGLKGMEIRTATTQDSYIGFNTGATTGRIKWAWLDARHEFSNGLLVTAATTLSSATVSNQLTLGSLLNGDGDNKFLTTDASGNVILKDAPAGGGASTITVTVPISAAALAPTITDGFDGGVQTGETSTNKVNFDFIQLSSSTTNYFQFSYSMPPDWDGSTVTYKVVWMPPAGSAAQDVVFGLQALGRGDNEDIDTAYGTMIYVTDTVQNASRVHISPESTALTIGGSVAAGDYIVWRGMRNYVSASDTLEQNAWLLELRITYTQALTPVQ